MMQEIEEADPLIPTLKGDSRWQLTRGLYPPKDSHDLHDFPVF
jgi:hypothetical protein